MAKIESVHQTVSVAPPAPARLEAYTGKYISPLRDTREAIRDFTSGLSAMGSVLGQLKQEEDELAFQKAYNEATTAIDRSYNELAASHQGAGASGFADSFGESSSKIVTDALANTSGRVQKQLDARLKAYQMKRGTESIELERSRLFQANNEQSAVSINNGVTRYANTGDESDLNAALEANGALQGRLNGSRPTEDSIYQFDDNVKNGFVMGRDGQKLRIVDKVEPGQTGVISKEQVSRVRDGLSTKLKAFKTSEQNIVDKACAARVDFLIKNDRYEEAYTFLEESMDGVPGRPLISEEAYSLVKNGLNYASEKYYTRMDAKAVLSDIGVKAVNEAVANDPNSKAYAGRYDVPEWEAKAEEALVAASQDTSEKGLKMYAALQQEINAERNRRKLALRNDAAPHLNLLSAVMRDKNTTPDAKRETLIGYATKVPADGPLHDVVEDARQKALIGLNKSLHTGAGEALFKKRMRLIECAFNRKNKEDRTVTFNVAGKPMTYDLNDYKNLEEAILHSGFSPAEADALRASYADMLSGKRNQTNRMASIIAEELNRVSGENINNGVFQPEIVIAMAPELVELALNYGEDTDDVVRKAVRSQILAINFTDPGIFTYTTRRLVDELREGIKDGSVIVDENGKPTVTFSKLTDKWTISMSSARALYRATPKLPYKNSQIGMPYLNPLMKQLGLTHTDGEPGDGVNGFTTRARAEVVKVRKTRTTGRYPDLTGLIR